MSCPVGCLLAPLLEQALLVQPPMCLHTGFRLPGVF